MNIYEKYLLKNQNTYAKLRDNQEKQNFRGNITRPIKTIQLGANEISLAKDVSRNYQQLLFMYKTAGNYIGKLFQNAVAFLLPVGAFGLLFKNASSSDEIKDVKLEREDGLNKSDELLTFTFCDEKEKDIAKFSVSKNGEAGLIADDELKGDQLHKYTAAIEKNFDQLLKSLLAKSNTALDSIENVLTKEDCYDFDLNSKSDLERVTSQFTDEKKRFSLMFGLVNPKLLYNTFKFDDGMPKSVEEGRLLDRDVSFVFNNLENRFFDGMQITVSDRDLNLKKGYVATSDGAIYSTKEHKLDDENDKFVPRVEWKIRNLTPMTENEIDDVPDLKNMFKYGYSLVDRIYKFLLNIFLQQNKTYAQMYDSASETKKNQINRIQSSKNKKIDEFNERINAEDAEKLAKRKKLEESPLSEDHARIMKYYDLTPENFDSAKRMASYYDDITEAYKLKADRLRKRIMEKFNLVRVKDDNGFIIKDLLDNKDIMLGIARYVYKESGEEVLAFPVYDKNFDEVARIKITKAGKAKFIAKPATREEDVEKIEEILAKELENGLRERLLNKLDEIAFYHQNMTKVDTYITKSCKPLTIPEAIKELRNPINYYTFRDSKIKKLKSNIESILEVSRKHKAAMRWQKIYFPDIAQKERYLYGRLDKYKINYEFDFIDNEYISGLRISTKNDKGKLTNIFVIDFKGNVYRLIKLPKKNHPKRLSYTPINLSRLNESAVKKSHLDLIFDDLYKTVDIYNDFLQECSNMMDRGKYKFLRGELEEIIAKFKSPDYTKIRALSPELKARYSDLLKPNGEFKSLEKISLKDVVTQLDRIFALPYTKRSPHLVHEKIVSNKFPDGKVVEGRFSTIAPDGAIVTVSRVISPKFVEFWYYSIKVHKDGETMYINIDPTNSMIIKSDENRPILENGYKVHYDGKLDFISQNPLSNNMSLYFMEIFDERLDAERQIIPFQKSDDKKARLMRQIMKDYQTAMTAQIDKSIQNELEQEMAEMEEADD